MSRTVKFDLKHDRENIPTDIGVTNDMHIIDYAYDQVIDHNQRYAEGLKTFNNRITR